MSLVFCVLCSTAFTGAISSCYSESQALHYPGLLPLLHNGLNTEIVNQSLIEGDTLFNAAECTQCTSRLAMTEIARLANGSNNIETRQLGCTKVAQWKRFAQI